VRFRAPADRRGRVASLRIVRDCCIALPPAGAARGRRPFVGTACCGVARLQAKRNASVIRDAPPARLWISRSVISLFACLHGDLHAAGMVARCARRAGDAMPI